MWKWLTLIHFYEWRAIRISFGILAEQQQQRMSSRELAVLRALPSGGIVHDDKSVYTFIWLQPNGVYFDVLQGTLSKVKIDS